VNRASYRLLVVAGWLWVALSIVVLVVFGALRAADSLRSAAVLDGFARRYAEHLWIGWLHFVPGLLFVTLAPLQFVAALRRRHPSVHRRIGWLLVPAAAVSGLFALLAAWRLPAYGGIGTQLATGVFGGLFLYSLARAVFHIRRREIAAHREWMIRVFALALAVATIRAVIALATSLTGASLEDVFAASFWIAFSLNLAVAEAWIRSSRRAATGRPPRPLA
jgi:uncharacterized membrane protein